MFGLVAAIVALAVPASGAELASKIERKVSAEAEFNGLVGMWYEAFVAPDGSIEACTVRGAIGDARAARKVCDEIVGRTVKPAVGSDARPTYGVYVGALNFADNIDNLPPSAPDMTIQAKGLPGGKGARVGLTVVVDADGKVSSCWPDGAYTALSRTACDQVQTAALPVRKSKAGAAVRYTSPLVVEFELDRG
jgi:hypothetical protein